MSNEANAAYAARMRYAVHMHTERDNAIMHRDACLRANDLEGAAAWDLYARLLRRAFGEWGKPLEDE